MEAPAVPTPSLKLLIRRVARAGFKADFIREAILPEWWSADCEADASLLGDVELRIARFLGLPVSAVRAGSGPLHAPAYPAARLRKVSSVEADRLGPAIHAALRIAEAVVRSLKPGVPDPNLPPSDPSLWRAQIQAARGPVVGLRAVVDDLWARGIPVVHAGVLPSPKFQGLACLAVGRPVVVLGHGIDEPPRLAFWLLHEAAHLANGDCEPDAPVVDDAEEIADQDPIEVRADAFAWTALTGGVAIPTPPSLEPRALANHAAAHAARFGIDAGVVAWSLAHRAGAYLAGKLALGALYRATGGRRLLREEFERHVDVDAASETDGQLLRCVAGGADGAAAAG